MDLRKSKGSLGLVLSMASTLALASAGCSSSTSTTTDGGGVTAGTSGTDGSAGTAGASSDVVAITTVDELPKASNPVESGATAASLVLKRTATSGMPLGTLDSGDFTDSSSIAACEMYNMTKHLVSSSLQGDLIQCYVTNITASATEEGTLQDTDGNPIDIYDNAYHIISLDFSGMPSEGEEDNSGPDKIKFKIGKDSLGNINSFEFFACRSGTQNEYLRQTITGRDFSMVSKETGSHTDRRTSSERTHQQSVTVTGKLNSDGSFVDSVNGASTPKEIRMRFLSNLSDDSENFYGSMDYDQYSDHAVMTNGTMSGSNTFHSMTGDVDCSFSNVIYGSNQLIDTNADGDLYNVSNLALGDGAVKYLQSGTCGDQTHTQSNIEAWNGDTIAALPDASLSSFYADVADQTITAAAEPTVSFDTDETWDCSGTAEGNIDIGALLEVVDTNPMEACANLELSHNHIDCWQLVHEGHREEPADQGGAGNGGQQGGGGQGGGGQGGGFGGGGSGGGGEHHGIALCEGMSSSTPATSENIQAFCDCNGGDTAMCTALSTMCSGAANMGACLTIAQSHE